MTPYIFFLVSVFDGYTRELRRYAVRIDTREHSVDAECLMEYATRSVIEQRLARGGIYLGPTDTVVEIVRLEGAVL